MLEIKIGKFIQEHLDKIVHYCNESSNELSNLLDREYSKEYLGLIANYSFLISKYDISNDMNERYWKKDLHINNKIYRACSQFGGSVVTEGQTRSEIEGNIFLNYLKNKNLLLDKYKGEEIRFIVGSSNHTPTEEYNHQETKNKTSSNIIKNIILYGVAGVGKTHSTSKLIKLIEDKKSDKEIFDIIKNNKSYSEDIYKIKNRVKFITFHQSFGYEDFIEGFRPNEEGNIELVDGIFKSIALEAIGNQEQNYYLVIDEINRGNISKIFGELITLIEESKRDNLEVVLPYSKEPFKIPSNLYIIGTMNSSDKSIALIDIALRRRFTFLKMIPNSKLIKYNEAKDLFEKLNEFIDETLGEEYFIGHSYFMNVSNSEELEFVWEYKIVPLLEEYYYGDLDNLKIAKSYN